MLEGTREQHQLLLEARQRPYVLDDQTVARAVRVYGAQATIVLALAEARTAAASTAVSSEGTPVANRRRSLAYALTVAGVRWAAGGSGR